MKRKTGKIANHSGFSLIEMLVSAGLIGFVVLIAAGVYLHIQKEVEIVKASARLEEDLIRASYTLKLYISQAVDLRFSPAPIAQTASNLSTGVVTQFSDSQNLNVTPDPVEVLAVFYREDQNRELQAGLQSAFSRTALFYQKPTARSPGILYLDMGVEPLLSPTRGDQIFGDIIDLEISPQLPTGVAPAAGARVSSIEIQIVMRKPLAGSPLDWRWCNDRMRALLGAACTDGNQAFRDIRKTIRIPLRDNLLRDDVRTSNRIYEYLFGGLYFFKTRTEKW